MFPIVNIIGILIIITAGLALGGIYILPHTNANALEILTYLISMIFLSVGKFTNIEDDALFYTMLPGQFIFIGVLLYSMTTRIDILIEGNIGMIFFPMSIFLALQTIAWKSPLLGTMAMISLYTSLGFYTIEMVLHNDNINLIAYFSQISTLIMIVYGIVSSDGTFYPEIIKLFHYGILICGSIALCTTRLIISSR